MDSSHATTRSAPAWRRPILGLPAVRYLACAGALNVPFLVCHPGWTLLDLPPVRSLAIGTVLFLAPGLPLVGAMIGRGWLPRFGLLWAIAASFAVFVAVLAVTNLAGIPLSGSTVWNGTWILTNLALLLNVLLGGPPGWGIRFGGGHWPVSGPLFVVAYLMFYWGATRVVPPREDHDLDVQGPGYSLLTRFTPEVVNDRNLLYYFAHPLLLNCYEAASFLYYDQLDYLTRFETATDRVRRAESGEDVEPVVSEFYRFPDTRVAREPGEPEEGGKLHQVVDLGGGRYRVDPPLPEWGKRVQVQELSIRELEVLIFYDDYDRDPRRLETRTPNIFLAALTVALLGGWIFRRGGPWWLALLVPAAYATSPEAFVRSSYGGYFAISMFALVQILLAVERWTSDRSRAAWWGCFLAGIFAALANNKLVMLPAALVIWQFSRPQEGNVGKRLVRAVGQPVVLGFLAGTLAFCIYGLAISPGDFRDDYVRIHLLDRMTHHDPLRDGGYPTRFWRVGERMGLWQEFWQHTGYVLLPLGIAAVGFLCSRKNATKDAGETGKLTVGWQGMAGLWAVWMLLTAAAFTQIDWRQTKHLMPLLLPLHLAPARWATSGRTVLVAVSAVFAGLLVWNLGELCTLVTNFDAFTITPAW